LQNILKPFGAVAVRLLFQFT